MKLQEPTEVVVNEKHYFIRPFPAFRAANISGEVIKVVVPIIGSVLPFVSTSGDTSVLDTDLATIAPEITKAFESLSGDAVEKLLRDLLVRGNNIAVDFNGETKPLTEDLVSKYGKLDLEQFTDLELRMYTLIKAQLASMQELKEYYTLDEALKLYALYMMEVDIEHCRNEEMKNEARRAK